MHQRRISQGGFSTLEILIAMSLMVSTIVSVVLLCFGNQSLLISGSSGAAALNDAQGLIEETLANSRIDFRLLANATSSDGFYEKDVAISNILSDPYTTKRVTATVSWNTGKPSQGHVTLSTSVTDFEDPQTLDTCDSFLSGDWMNPSIHNYPLSTGNILPIHLPSGHSFGASGTIASIDAYRGLLAVGVGKKASVGDDSLFLFSISNPSSMPQYISSINNNSSLIEGVSAVSIAGPYLYAGNTHVSNFKTCKPSANCSHLQVFDISNPSAIHTVANFLIPTSSPAFVTGTSSSQALSNALYYASSTVYIGLTKTATGPEFNIIDVQDPVHPVWIGGYRIGASINHIYVRNGYAFISDDDKSRELIILDIRDPAHPQLVSTFDPSGTLGYEVGKSVYRRGNILFSGMSFAFGSPELYVFDVTHPYTPIRLGSYAVGGTILGMFARDATLFLLVSSLQQFLMLNISNPASPRAYGMPTVLPGMGTSLDCEGNYFFIGSNATTSGYVSLVGPHI